MHQGRLHSERAVADVGGHTVQRDFCLRVRMADVPNRCAHGRLVTHVCGHPLMGGIHDSRHAPSSNSTAQEQIVTRGIRNHPFSTRPYTARWVRWH